METIEMLMCESCGKKITVNLAEKNGNDEPLCKICAESLIARAEAANEG